MVLFCVTVIVYGRVFLKALQIWGVDYFSFKNIDQLQHPPFFFPSPSFKLRAFSISRSSRSLNKLKKKQGQINSLSKLYQDSITYSFFGLSAWFASFQPCSQVSFQHFVGIIQSFICRVAYIQPYHGSEFIDIYFTNWHSNPTLRAKCRYDLISTLIQPLSAN